MGDFPKKTYGPDPRNSFGVKTPDITAINKGNGGYVEEELRRLPVLPPGYDGIPPPSIVTGVADLFR